MQEASEQTVLGDFNGVDYRYAGTTSRFFRRDGKFMVRTDGPDGKLADFEIATPWRHALQHLVESPGAISGASIAWDHGRKRRRAALVPSLPGRAHRPQGSAPLTAIRTEPARRVPLDESEEGLRRGQQYL
jgi:hypothetical protein